MDNKRYRLLMVWKDPFHLDLFETIHESFESVLSSARAIQIFKTGEYSLYFLEYDYGVTKSVTLGRFTEKAIENREDTPPRDYDGSWPALNDAIKAIKEHEEKSLHPPDCKCPLCWTEFKPFEPLPVDEEGNPYFPPDTKGIVVANYEIRQPGEKRFQFLDEEEKDEIPNPDNLE